MAEAAPVGTLVVTEPRSHYDVGDVVTYTHDDRTITHRIVETDGDVFRTRGDLNGSADPWDVRPDQIIGAATLIAPGLGFVLKAAPCSCSARPSSRRSRGRAPAVAPGRGAFG